MEITRKMLVGLVVASILGSNAVVAEDSTATEPAQDNVAKVSLEKAKQANEAAAKAAAETVLADTRLDLDIRLIGPTSVTIASER